MDSWRFRFGIPALYRNVHGYHNVRHNGPFRNLMCRAINHCNKQRWQVQTFKVPLRFMFHYCMTQRRRLQNSQPPGGLRPSESAACGYKKRLTMPDKGSFDLIVSVAMRK